MARERRAKRGLAFGDCCLEREGGQSLGVVQELTARRGGVAGVELASTREFDPSGRLLRSLFPPVDESD